MFTTKNTDRNIISFAAFEIKFRQEYDYLNKYFELNRTRIQETARDLEDSLLNEISENPENENINNEFYETKLKSIISFYYHSSITLVHSFIENQLVRICQIIKEETNNKFALSDLKGSDYIKTSLDYLVLTTSLELDFINRHKPRIGKFQKLRNKIIHDNSTYKDDSSKQSLLNDFNTKLEFNEIEKRFYLNSDELPVEYLGLSNNLITELIDFLNSKEFHIIREVNIVDMDDTLPFD